MGNQGEPDCCVGLTGNVDNDPDEIIGLGDLTELVDYLYISFKPPVCMETANNDGDPTGLVDVGNLTALFDLDPITNSRPDKPGALVNLHIIC